MKREDPFGGAWKLNGDKSQFDPNHRPSSATMHWERTPERYKNDSRMNHGRWGRRSRSTWP